jgi:apolipoprotein N-acyltransferase
MLGVDTQDPHVAGLLAGRGARILTSSTHDWSQLAPQHRAFARTAARASGIPLVRADWRYGSAIYDSSGEALADAGTEPRRTVVVAPVERNAAASPYASLGDAVGWGAVAAALLMIAAGALGDRSMYRPAPLRH